jgi:hypothetical protein
VTTSTKDTSARRSIEELRARRGLLAQALQGALLEGLPTDDDDEKEVAALDDELRRRDREAR